MDLAGVSEQDIELIAEPRRILIRGHRRTRELAAQFGRERGSFEFQMLYGVRPDPEEQLVQ
jgi:HSP20 family molecular chaperone IbpA